MKYYLTGCVAVGFALFGVSCEQHRWENKVKVIEEPVFDEEKKPVMVKNADRELVQMVEKSSVVEEFGAVSFFYDEYGEKRLKEQAKGNSGSGH